MSQIVIIGLQLSSYQCTIYCFYPTRLFMGFCNQAVEEAVVRQRQSGCHQAGYCIVVNQSQSFRAKKMYAFIYFKEFFRNFKKQSQYNNVLATVWYLALCLASRKVRTIACQLLENEGSFHDNSSIVLYNWQKIVI